jgi:2-desacetyl-2-hydroxyethyl bacteriochlorophyllide A dehydrogenase
MSMPQVRIHGVEDVRLDSVEKPVIASDDVLVQVSQCGICGSDIGYISMGGLGMTQPMPLGHELAGTVAEVGDKVTHLSVGDRVVVNPMEGNNGIGNGGAEGGFAPYLLVRGAAASPDVAMKIPDSLSMEQAAMVEPLSVALHGCHRGEVSAEDKAVIFGAGPIGLCTAICLKYLGLEKIVAVDMSEYRLAAAESIGAIAFKPGSSDLAEFLMDQHGTTNLAGMPVPVPVPATDIYLEATGAKPVFEQLVNTARTGARVVILGLHKQPVELDLANVLLRELKLIGSMGYADEFPEVIRILTSGEVDVSQVITHRFPLTDFDQALAQAKTADEAIKVLVDCQS